MNPRLLRPLATGFNPKSIPDLWTWWDFSDTTTLAQNSNGTTAATADGDPVGYVADKAGTRNLTQSTNSLRGSLTISGLGGRKSVYISNTTTAGFDWTSPANFSDLTLTWFLVARYTGSASWLTIHNSVGASFFDAADATSAPNANAWSGLQATPTFRANGAAISPTVTRSVLRTALGVNVGYLLTVRGVRHNTGTGTAWRLGRLGGSFDFIGDLGEILAYNRSLSDTEVGAVERYLKGKWKTP